MDGVLESNLSKLKNRIVVYQFYIDAYGNKVKDKLNGYMQEFIISYDEYIESTSEDYNEENEYGKGKKDIQSVLGEASNLVEFISSDFIYPEDYNKLSDFIESKLDYGFKAFSLKILNSNVNIKISTSLIYKIFNLYRNIYLDFNSLENWVSLPEKTIDLDNLVIKNANLKVGNSNYKTTNKLQINNCVLKRLDDSYVPTFIIQSFVEINVYEIYMAEPIYLTILTSQTDKHEWKHTTLFVSNINIVFEDLKKSKSGSNYKPLISIVGAYNGMISGIASRANIPYYPLLSLKRGNNYSVSNIFRFYNGIPAKVYSVELSSVPNANISGVNYVAKPKGLKNTSFFKFVNSPVNAEYSIMSFKLIGTNFSNFTGIKMRKLSVMDGVCSGYNFAKCNMSSIYKMVLINSKIDVEDFSVESFNMNISDSKITSNDFNVMTRNNLTLDKNVIRCDNCNVSLNYNGNSTISNSYIFSDITNIKTTIPDEIIEENVTKELNESSVKLLNTNLCGDIITSNINNLEFIESNINKTNKIDISNIGTMSFVSGIKYRNAPIEFKAKNVKFYNSSYKIDQSYKQTKLSFDNCEGDFNVGLTNSDENNLLVLDLNNSSLISNIDSSNIQNAKIKSSNNKGSIILGDKNVKLSIDMSSLDMDKFEHTNNKNIYKDVDKIYYGNYIEE